MRNARPAAGASPANAAVWTKKRPARTGSSPDWLSVTQSASGTRSGLARAPAALGASARIAAIVGASGFLSK